MIHEPNQLFKWSTLILLFLASITFAVRASASNGHGPEDAFHRDTDMASCASSSACDALTVQRCVDAGGSSSTYACATNSTLWQGSGPTLAYRTCSAGYSNLCDWYYWNEVNPACDGTLPEPCPAECPFVDGESFIKSGSGSPPASICNGGCNLVQNGPNIAMDGGYTGSYSVQGSCSGGDPDPPDALTDNLNCVSSSNGTQYCVDPNATENCGTVNGEYVCLNSIPDGACIFTGSGQAICNNVSAANTPADTITDPDGNSFDVFPNGTGGQAGGGATPGTNDSDGDGQPGSVGDGSGEGTCPSWEDCDETHSGGLADIPDDGCDFGCIMGAFWTDINAGPWGQSLNSVALTSGAAACPAPSFAIFDTTFTMDFHCSLGETVRTMLSIVFLGIWGLAATRVVLSA